MLRKYFENKRVPFILLVLFFVFYMQPYIVNGFWDDDSQNSNVIYFAERFGLGFWAFSMRVTEEWILRYGRVALAWPYIYGFFSLSQDVFWVRVAHVVLIFFDVGLSAYLLKLLRFDLKFCLVFGFFVVGQFQIRNMYEPVGASAGFFTGLHVLFVTSVILFVLFLRSGRLLYIYLSVIPLGVSFLAYEINIQFYMVVFFGFLLFRNSITVSSISTVIASFVAFFVANYYVRWAASGTYNGLVIGDVSGFLSTFISQFFSALPLSYYAGVGFGTPSIGSALMSTPWATGVLVMALAGLFLVRCLPSGRSDESSPEWRLAAVVFATQWIVPAGLVAVSQKYQEIVSFGNGYCLVYYQYFGSAFFLAYAVSFLQAGSKAKQAVIATGCVMIGLQFAVNNRLQQERDAVFKRPREAFETLLKSGFSAVEDGDTLRISSPFPGVEGNTVFKITGKRVFVPEEHGPDAEYWFPGQSRPRPDGCSFSVVYDKETWRLTSDGPCDRTVPTKVAP